MASISKIVLVGIYDTNTVSLAPEILRAYADPVASSHGIDIMTREFSIFSDTVQSMTVALTQEAPDVVGFSVYIWNVNEVLAIIQSLPQVTVILGGPHVTGVEDALLRDNPNIDIVVTGEGEETFKELTECFADQRAIETVKGITTRNHALVPRDLLEDLDAIPSVYERLLRDNPNITWVSLETSRGCPYGCRFCSWSSSRKMRYYSIERVKRELDAVLAQTGITDIYLCDSSLLVHKPRAKTLLRHIIDSGTDKRIRFEFSAEQLDDELIALLTQMTNGEYNFGLQSVNPDALREMGRQFHQAKFEENYRKLIEGLDEPNITIDLIYGLPGDDIEGFKDSLEYAMSLDKVGRILTNPLLALPGSPFFREKDRYGITLQGSATCLVKETATFPEAQMELARAYSFYVATVYLNHRLLLAVKTCASDRCERGIDVIIRFMQGVDADMVGNTWPDMIPADRRGFSERNESLLAVMESYGRLVDAFRVFSDHRYDELLVDYEKHFSRQYLKLKQFMRR